MPTPNFLWERVMSRMQTTMATGPLVPSEPVETDRKPERPLEVGDYVRLDCPDCGRSMRIAADRDAAECRCGLWVGGEHAFSGAAIPRSAFEMGTPFVDPPAGLRVSDRFADVGIGWERWEVPRDAVPSKEALEVVCANALERSELRFVGKVKGCRSMLLEDPPGSGKGETLCRHAMYALVPLGNETVGVCEMLWAILKKHGPGRIWSAADVLVTYLSKVSDGEGGVRGVQLSGVNHVVIASYYFHKPDHEYVEVMYPRRARVTLVDRACHLAAHFTSRCPVRAVLKPRSQVRLHEGEEHLSAGDVVVVRPSLDGAFRNGTGRVIDDGVLDLEGIAAAVPEDYVYRVEPA